MNKHDVALGRARQRIAELAEKNGGDQFAREVRAGAWDDRSDLQAAYQRELEKLEREQAANSLALGSTKEHVQARLALAAERQATALERIAGVLEEAAKPLPDEDEEGLL